MNKVINLNEVAKKNTMLENMMSIESQAIKEPVEIEDTIKQIDNIKLDKVFEENNKYVKITNKGTEVLSNFIIKPLELIQTKDAGILKIEIHTDEDEIIETTVNTIDLVTANNFKNTICRKYFTLSLRASAQDWEDIRLLLKEKNCFKKQGLETIGMIKEKGKYLFISNDGCIDGNGELVNTKAVVNNDNCITTNLIECDPINREELESISKALFNFNDITITATALGFSAGCFLKKRLIADFDTKFTHLIVHGEAGTGKSETVDNIIMPIFASKSSVDAGNITEFTNTKMVGSSNLVPYLLDEFKKNKLTKKKKDIISGMMRSVYDDRGGQRGTEKQNIKKYEYNAPIMIVGELLFDEAAILDRSNILEFTKGKRSKEINEKSFNLLKDNKELLTKLGRGLINLALNLTDEEIQRRLDYFKDLVEDEFKDRVKNSIICVLLGLSLLEDVYDSVGLNIEEETGYFVDQIQMAVIQNMYNTRGRETKSIMDNTLLIIDDMAEQGILEHEKDYRILDDELALNVNGFYDKVLKYVKSRGMADMETYSVKEFGEKLTTMEYYICRKSVRFKKIFDKHGNANSVVKCRVLNIEKLKERLELSSLI